MKPINAMIDAAVKCCKCGKSKVECDRTNKCWITFRCPKCNKVRMIDRDPVYDPKDSVECRVRCLECGAGGKDQEARHFDKHGREIFGAPA